MSQAPIDSRPSSVPYDREPRRTARVLAGVRETALGGGRAPATAPAPRAVIEASWRRAVDLGINPDYGSSVDVLSADEIEQRRHRTPIGEVLTVLRDGLVSVADEA